MMTTTARTKTVIEIMIKQKTMMSWPCSDQGEVKNGTNKRNDSDYGAAHNGRMILLSLNSTMTEVLGDFGEATASVSS